MHKKFIVATTLIVLSVASIWWIEAKRMTATAQSAVQITVRPVGVVGGADTHGSAPGTARQHNAQSTKNGPSSSISENKIVDFGRFRSRYTQLLASANAGDTDAALELAKGLRACVGLPRTQDAVADAKRQIAIDFAQDSSAYNDSLTFLNDKIQGCAGFSDADLAASTDWLAKASAAGNDNAKLAYISIGRPSDNQSPNFWEENRAYEEKAKEYLADELAKGNAGALFTASRNYAQGGLFDPNTGKELSYLYAYTLAANVTSGPIFDRLQAVSNEVPPALRTSAMQEGEAIYQHCCVNQ